MSCKERDNQAIIFSWCLFEVTASIVCKKLKLRCADVDCKQFIVQINQAGNTISSDKRYLNNKSTPIPEKMIHILR